MGSYRYSQWNGQQDFSDLDEDSLLTELELNLTAYGDVSLALWKMQREGIRDKSGMYLPGNRELYQRLEQKKQALADRYDYSHLTRALRHQLEKIIDAEKLTELPADIDRQLEMLKQHHFSNPDARREMERLLDALQNNSLESLGGAGNRPAGTGTGRAATPASQTGKEPLSLSDAVKLLAMLQKMDRLETQLKQNQNRHSLNALDSDLVRDVLGEEAAISIGYLYQLDSRLVEAGYLRQADGQYELTPRAVRKIGQKALEEILARLKHNGNGYHNLDHTGNGAFLDETKKYEFGDDFNIHLFNTLMNSLTRAPKRPPLNLTPDDFETLKMESLTRSATVLMLDLSRSMLRNDNFRSAKKVALALSELIRTRYPTDSLFIIGFATYARQIAHDDLPGVSWDSRNRDTNIQHGLLLARQLLVSRQASI